jgi:sphingomyelin phosphodiesterase acid-like 3
MILNRYWKILRNAFALALLAAALIAPHEHAAAQTATQQDKQGNDVSALLLSDFHFDPFHDPAKAQRLAAAPISEWESILAAPSSADQAKAFAALQQSCQARGVDTPYAVLQSSLQAMREKASHAGFITVSGDLLAHSFDCRYKALFPGKSQADYELFSEKTVNYLIGRVRSSFPGVPVYVALGNNDSGCGDYRMDVHGGFLAGTEKAILAALPPSSESAKTAADYETGGYYSVPMAAPMLNTRLIVLNNIFLSSRYASCSGSADQAAVTAQLTWLEKQLGEARSAHQKVWVMAHIPPGVDLYSTFVHMRNVCGGDAPVMFLSSEKMADILLDYADVVRFVLLGHTHMDEMRLLKSEAPAAKTGPSIAIKLVPSISPVNGNNPAFTVASIDPATAIMRDYAVFAASNQTGIATTWSKEYTYSDTYHQADFSPASVQALVDEFNADPEAKSAASQAYVHNYFVSGPSGGPAATLKATAMLKSAWPLYVCAVDHNSAKGFAACACSGSK